MRLEQLSLRIPGDEFRVRFHERLTVLSGIGILERQALFGSLLSSLAGGPEATSLLCRDSQGRRLNVECERGRLQATWEDGTPAPAPLDLLDQTVGALRSLMLLSGSDLGLSGSGLCTEPPQLAEARATLTALADELQAAITARASVDAMRNELGSIDERIRLSEENRARRQYARLLADLERVRSEAAALRSGQAGIDADRHLIGSGDRARQLSAAWKEAAGHTLELVAAFGDGERLDPRALADVSGAPEAAPTDIDSLVEAVEKAEAERVAMAVRLREMASSRLSEPSHPAVVDLARADQVVLWSANARALEMSARVQAESVALGDSSGAVTEEIERQHGEVVEAEQQLESSKRPAMLSGGGGAVAGVVVAAAAPFAAPVFVAAGAAAAGWLLLKPKRRLAKAQQLEEQALAQVGASTYLSFHLRRVDAILDPGARERLELAVLEQRAALSAWAEVAPGIDPWTAADVRDEVEGYAVALRELGETATEIESLRRQLVERVEPAAARARDALLAVCAPYGIDDPFLAAELVRHQVTVGRLARIQVRLEAAEAVEAGLRAELDGLLRTIGFADGDLAARVGAFEWATTRAMERERARTLARPAQAVEAELAKLEDEARRNRRPEWVGVSPAEADEPDLDDLLLRREATAAAYSAARSLVPDVDRLVDRHNALERRVAVLETTHGRGTPDDTDVKAVRQYLLARLTQALGGGGSGEPVPVVIDDALVRLGGDAKWELLDLLERCSEKAQLIYLTDDPYVGAWARRRASSGAITLLEPVAESV